jgi:FkbM family methyltransferase
MIKNLFRRTAQRLLGFDRYLFWFARLGVWRLRMKGYEKEFPYFMDLLPDEGVILDIGANIGITTTALCRKCPGAFVYAFEPMPSNLHALNRIIHYYHLQNVKVFAHALGNTNGDIGMIMPEISNAKMHGLSHITEPGRASGKGEIISVPVRRLDDIEELSSLPKIIAIKLDVENFEYLVLQGGHRLIQQHNPIIYCELWGNERKEKCINLLQAAGYRVMICSKAGLVEYRDQPAINFFFLPR